MHITRLMTADWNGAWLFGYVVDRAHCRARSAKLRADTRCYKNGETNSRIFPIPFTLKHMPLPKCVTTPHLVVLRQRK